MNPVTISLSLPNEQLELLEMVKYQNDKIIAMTNKTAYLTEQEACERLKVSLTTIRVWRKEGWLRYFAQGGGIAEFLATHPGYMTAFGCLAFTIRQDVVHGSLKSKVSLARNRVDQYSALSEVFTDQERELMRLYNTNYCENLAKAMISMEMKESKPDDFFQSDGPIYLYYLATRIQLQFSTSN
eukprot:gene21299-27327_t